MFRYLIIFFLFISIALSSCKRLPVHSAFVNQNETVHSCREVLQFQPQFGRALYETSVDVIGKHLSGLLLIKRMPDSSLRIVFTNEMGVSYFDFEFPANGGFVVHTMMKKMNKKAVKKTLQHDFELVLMNRLGSTPPDVYRNGSFLYYVFQQQKGFAYYITDTLSHRLIRMERASKKKTIATAMMGYDFRGGIPDTIGISHTGFNFNIGLKRIHDEESAQ